MSSTILIEVLAAAAAIAGTLALAQNAAWSGWGFVLYLVSNAGWIAYALHHGAWILLAQQAVFAAISVQGIWKWLVKPMRKDWPMGPCFVLHRLADTLFSFGARHPFLHRQAWVLSGLLDKVALRLYLRLKPAGKRWNAFDGRWESEA